MTNTVITTKNYKYLPEIANFLVKLKVDQFQFTFLHIGGTVLKNQNWIIPCKKMLYLMSKRVWNWGER